MKKGPLLSVGVAVSCGLFILSGLYFLGQGARNIWWAVSSNGWPAAAGKVVASTVEADGTYGAKIAVKFRVDGREYVADRIRFGETLGSSDSSEAELRQRRYPEGAAVKVVYKPDDPSIAAVKPGFHAEALWLPGAGLAWAMPGVMFLLLYFGSGSSGSGMAAGAGVFAAIFAGIGIAMLMAGGLRLWRAHASESWPKAAGKIVYEKTDATTSTRVNKAGNTIRSTSYGAALVYEYEANGETHISNLRQFGQLAGSSPDWAEAIVRQYPEGKEIPVAYWPEDPDLAVIEPGIHPDAYWLPGAGLAFLLFAGLVALIIVPAMARDPF